MTLWHMTLHAEYLRLQTHTHYLILTPVPLEQWLHESTSMLYHTYIACLFDFAVAK